MNFEALVRSRRSVRAYDSTVVPEAALGACLEAARLAPSACNAQPWHFVVVREAQARGVLARASVPPVGGMNRFVAQAPVIVAVVAERPNIASQVGGALKNKPFYLIDIGIAAEHFCLQAAELGLGTCMIGWFGERLVNRTLGVPRGRRVVLLITVGYAPRPERRGQSALVDAGQATDGRGALLGTGDATGGRGALLGTGDATGGRGALLGTGDATDGRGALLGTGDATGGRGTVAAAEVMVNRAADSDGHRRRKAPAQVFSSERYGVPWHG